MGRRLEAQYIEIARRLQPSANVGAATISVLIIASVASDTRALVIAIALHLLVVPMNVVITSRLVPRFGPRIEVPRTILNIALTSVGYHLIGWPIAVWLWLPFGALAFDQSGGRHTYVVVILMCTIQGTVGILDGVPVGYPIGGTLFAALCWMSSRARVSIIRDMLERSERQRDELAATHDELTATHDELTATHAALRQHVTDQKRLQLELQQAQKLEAVGRLATGVAHELNTPIQYVSDSIQFLRDATGDLFTMVDLHHEASRQVIDGTPDAELALAAIEAEQELQLDYVRRQLPRAFESVIDGLDRVTTIVRSMKVFAHPDHKEMTEVDLNHSIESTLIIARNEYKYVADLETTLAELPPVMCHPSEINQVVLNLLINAAHAIEDVVRGSGRKGKIVITTRQDHDDVVIRISDTGGGIPAAIQDRIYDPFFTTKEVGRGTGQGLAMARSVVVDKHRGALTFETEDGRGTTFVIRIPIVHHRVELAA